MTMLEKACAAAYALHPIGVRPWEDCPVAEAEAIRATVRAVLEAIREPDAAVGDAGYCDHIDGAPENEDGDWDRHWANLCPEDVFPAMIDAILKGEAT